METKVINISNCTKQDIHYHNLFSDDCVRDNYDF